MGCPKYEDDFCMIDHKRCHSNTIHGCVKLNKSPQTEQAKGSAEFTGCTAKGEKELKRLLLAVNKVTAQHRHGVPVTRKNLDNLANRQLEYEEAL